MISPTQEGRAEGTLACKEFLEEKNKTKIRKFCKQVDGHYLGQHTIAVCPGTL